MTTFARKSLLAINPTFDEGKSHTESNRRTTHGGEKIESSKNAAGERTYKIAKYPPSNRPSKRRFRVRPGGRRAGCQGQGVSQDL
jgi:hypothetical protein